MITAKSARKSTARNRQQEQKAEEEKDKARHRKILSECERDLPGWIKEAEAAIRSSTTNSCTLSQTIRRGLHYPNRDGTPKISELIEPFQELIRHFTKGGFKASLQLEIDGGSSDSYYQICLRW